MPKRVSNGRRDRSGKGEQPAKNRPFLDAFDGLFAQLSAAREGGIYPLFPCFAELADGWGALDGQRKIVLLANNYLGLAGDPRVKNAAARAIEQFGTSACASPLAGGFTQLHRQLAARLAAFLEREDSVLFASGYQANLGVVSALVGPGDLVVSDLFNHASIVDGARLSGAELRFFQHNDADHLGLVLERVGQGRRVLVIVEGIYSVDGDIGALRSICATAHAHDALVMVDEAHSLGVIGPGGRGAVAHFGVGADVIVGTLSKSLGSVGGFVSAHGPLIDVIRHRARALIYSAALSPASAAAALAALEILESDPAPRSRLWENTRFMLDALRSRGFDVMRSETPVIVVRVGEPVRTLMLTTRLREEGVLVCPVVPPMVQPHLSRIRAHVTAAHDRPTLARAVDIMARVADSLELRSTRPVELDRSETP